jgi:hypothetical protein
MSLDQDLLDPRMIGIKKVTNNERPCILHPAPCTLHPAPCTLHPAPCTLHPAPCTLHPAPCTLHPAPCTLHPAPCTLHPAPCTLHLAPCTLHPAPCTLHPAPCTLHPAPCTLHLYTAALPPLGRYPSVTRTRQRIDSAGRFCFGLHLRLQKPMPAGGERGAKVPEPEVFFKVRFLKS